MGHGVWNTNPIIRFVLGVYWCLLVRSWYNSLFVLTDQVLHNRPGTLAEFPQWWDTPRSFQASWGLTAAMHPAGSIWVRYVFWCVRCFELRLALQNVIISSYHMIWFCHSRSVSITFVHHANSLKKLIWQLWAWMIATHLHMWERVCICLNMFEINWSATKCNNPFTWL